MGSKSRNERAKSRFSPRTIPTCGRLLLRRLSPPTQSAVAMITAASNLLPADRTIDDNVTDLASYGLAPAADQVIFKLKDGKTKTLLIGDSNPTGNNVYAKVADDTHLYTMGSSSKTTFDKESKDLRDKRLLTFDQEKATRVELNAKKESIEFGRINQTDWQAETEALARRRFRGGGTGPQAERSEHGHQYFRGRCQESGVGLGNRNACRDRESY